MKTYALNNYSGLKVYNQSQLSRLQPKSTDKPFIIAHYNNIKIAGATQENVCVNNGLHYSMFDSTNDRLAIDFLGKCDVRKMCTFQLPPGPYASLQFALDNTTHTSNEVIALQAECPSELSLQEFYEFCMLRSGHRLQWRNIAVDLVSRVLDFRREESYLLVAQAAWQVGPSSIGNYLRESHLDFEDRGFGAYLLSSLEDALKTVQGSWQNSVAVRILVLLATRLLSLSPDIKVQRGSKAFLKQAQDITLEWTREVSQLLDEQQNSELLEDLRLRNLELALTCHSTFDVDEDHITMVLETPKDVSIIVECSVIIQDLCPATIDQFSPSIKLLIWRFKRISQQVESHLRGLILKDPTGIDMALKRVWAGYHPGQSWTAMAMPNQRWLWSKTGAPGPLSKTVHYDILTGDLLVNGSPLTRLPKSYEAHTTYRRLFKSVSTPSTTKYPELIFRIRRKFYA